MKKMVGAIGGTRKAWILLLIVAFLLGACSSGSQSGQSGQGSPSPSASSTSASLPAAGGQKVTIDYWYWVDDAQNDTIAQLIDKFNAEHPDIQVVGRLVPFNEFQQTLINA